MRPLFHRSDRNRNRARSRSRRPQFDRMEERTLLSAVSWTGQAGDNNWDMAGNWNTDSIPSASDDATISVAANVQHSSNAVDSVRSLMSSQPLTIAGGTLSIATASSVDGTLTMNGGTLSGAGDISVGGLLTLTSGTLAGSGKVTANGGTLINPGGHTFFIYGRTVVNPVGQTAIWTQGGSYIQGSDGALFENLGTFLAENINDALLDGTDDGQSGSNFETNLNWKNVVLSLAEARRLHAEAHAKPAGALAHRFVSRKI
jgi:hypothetical protein